MFFSSQFLLFYRHYTANFGACPRPRVFSWQRSLLNIFLCSFSLLGIVPAVFSLPPLPTAAARGGISGGIWVYERLRNRATKVMSKLRGKNFVLRILFECLLRLLIGTWLCSLNNGSTAGTYNRTQPLPARPILFKGLFIQFYIVLLFRAGEKAAL